MWHQIAENLVNYTKNAVFDQTENQDLVQLYDEVIKSLSLKINPLKYSIITVSVSRQFSDLEQAIKFLDDAKTRLQGKQDALFLLRIAQGEKKLNLG